jgi:hypothetical protein
MLRISDSTVSAGARSPHRSTHADAPGNTVRVSCFLRASNEAALPRLCSLPVSFSPRYLAMAVS